MTYTYTLTVIDEEGNLVVDHPLTADRAIQLLAEALADRPAFRQEEPEEEIPAVPSKPGKKQAASKQPSKRKCSQCSKPGHIARHCTGAGAAPATDEETEPRGIGTGREKRIKELLKNGHDDDFIAVEANTSPRVVKFIRRQMQQAGELM